jgi:hypothetical protein
VSFIFSALVHDAGSCENLFVWRLILAARALLSFVRLLRFSFICHPYILPLFFNHIQHFNRTLLRVPFQNSQIFELLHQQNVPPFLRLLEVLLEILTEPNIFVRAEVGTLEVLFVVADFPDVGALLFLFPLLVPLF